MFILLTLLSALSTCECYKILCLLPYPGKSHHMVFEPLIAELSERGHNVTTVSFFPASNSHPNRRDVSLVGLADLNVEVIDLSTMESSIFGDFLSHIPVITGLAKANLALCEKLLYSDVFKEFIEAKENYDVILLEHFNSDCMLGLVYNYGVPSIGLSSCAFLPWMPSRLGAPENPSYVPGMTLQLTDDMTFFQRLQNLIIHVFYKWWYEIAIRWNEQKLLERRLGRELPRLSEVAENTSVLLVNTYHSLNGVRVMPPTFVEVGGIHLYNRTVQPLPEDLENWVSGAKNGFIVFSFGSLIRGSTFPPERLGAILNVFKGLSQRIVWKWEEEHFEDLPLNVRVLRWLPQYDLLLSMPVDYLLHGIVRSAVPDSSWSLCGYNYSHDTSTSRPHENIVVGRVKHPVVSPAPVLGLYRHYFDIDHPNCVGFITHAGLLSLTEAVSAGVPTVAVAVLGDQFGNAAHAERAGGSYKLVLSELDEDRFGYAVRKMLTEEKRTEAKLLSQKWKARPVPPMDTAVFYIEQTARFGGLHMSSHARKLNVIQLAMLDVIAFILCVIGIIIVSIVFIWRQCRRQRLSLVYRIYGQALAVRPAGTRRRYTGEETNNCVLGNECVKKKRS